MLRKVRYAYHIYQQHFKESEGSTIKTISMVLKSEKIHWDAKKSWQSKQNPNKTSQLNIKINKRTKINEINLRDIKEFKNILNSTNIGNPKELNCTNWMTHTPFLGIEQIKQNPNTKITIHAD